MEENDKVGGGALARRDRRETEEKRCDEDKESVAAAGQQRTYRARKAGADREALDVGVEDVDDAERERLLVAVDLAFDA